MIEEIAKKVMIEELEVVGKKIYCDECGKEVKDVYFDVTNGHEDWGRDSIDSMENYQYCCMGCLGEAMEKYFSKKEISRSNTAYFDIDKKRL